MGSPEQGEDAVGVADRVLVHLQQAVLLAFRQVLQQDNGSMVHVPDSPNLTLFH